MTEGGRRKVDKGELISKIETPFLCWLVAAGVLIWGALSLLKMFEPDILEASSKPDAQLCSVVVAMKSSAGAVRSFSQLLDFRISQVVGNVMDFCCIEALRDGRYFSSSASTLGLATSPTSANSASSSASSSSSSSSLSQKANGQLAPSEEATEATAVNIFWGAGGGGLVRRRRRAAVLRDHAPPRDEPRQRIRWHSEGG